MKQIAFVAMLLWQTFPSPGPGVSGSGGGGGSTIALVKTTNCVRINSGTNCALTTIGTGHVLLATINYDSGSATVTGITCTGASCTWVQGTSCVSHVTAAGESSDVWYVQSNPAGITDVTVTLSPAAAYQMTVYELSGQNAAAFDACTTISNHSAGANPSGPAITPSVANEFVATTLVTATNVTAVGGGFTLNQIDTSGGGHANDATTGTGTFTPTWTMSSGAYAGTTVAVK